MPSLKYRSARTEPLAPPNHGYRKRNGWIVCRYDTTTPSGFACHPSKGGELPCADTTHYERICQIAVCATATIGISIYKGNIIKNLSKIINNKLCIYRKNMLEVSAGKRNFLLVP